MNQVGGLDRRFSESQVRHRHTAGLLGIIVKIRLRVHVGIVTDNLDGVLVRTDRSVRTQTPEFAIDRAFRSGHQVLASLQRQIGHIVHDADGEFLLGIVVEGSHDICRYRILGTQTITAAEYRNRSKLAILQCSNDIQRQRLMRGTRLLGSVKHFDSLHGLRNRF